MGDPLSTTGPGGTGGTNYTSGVDNKENKQPTTDLEKETSNVGQESLVKRQKTDSKVVDGREGKELKATISESGSGEKKLKDITNISAKSLTDLKQQGSDDDAQKLKENHAQTKLTKQYELAEEFVKMKKTNPDMSYEEFLELKEIHEIQIQYAQDLEEKQAQLAQKKAAQKLDKADHLLEEFIRLKEQHPNMSDKEIHLMAEASEDSHEVIDFFVETGIDTEKAEAFVDNFIGENGILAADDVDVFARSMHGGEIDRNHTKVENAKTIIKSLAFCRASGSPGPEEMQHTVKGVVDDFKKGKINGKANHQTLNLVTDLAEKYENNFFSKLTELANTPKNQVKDEDIALKEALDIASDKLGLTGDALVKKLKKNYKKSLHGKMKIKITRKIKKKQAEMGGDIDKIELKQKIKRRARTPAVILTVVSLCQNQFKF